MLSVEIKIVSSIHSSRVQQIYAIYIAFRTKNTFTVCLIREQKFLENSTVWEVEERLLDNVTFSTSALRETFIPQNLIFNLREVLCFVSEVVCI